VGRHHELSRQRTRELWLFGVAVRGGAAVVSGLLPVLGSLAAVGFGLEPVQGCLVPLV